MTILEAMMLATISSGLGRHWDSRQLAATPVGKRSASKLMKDQESMPLEEAQLKKVKVAGNYFSWDKSSSTLTYLGTPECTDPAPYSAESILALVELTYTGSHAYTFRDEKMPSKLDALLEALGRQSTPSEVAQRASAATKRAADQNGDNEEGAGRASKKAQQGTLIAGVSFTGRPTTRGAVR